MDNELFTKAVNMLKKTKRNTEHYSNQDGQTRRLFAVNWRGRSVVLTETRGDYSLELSKGIFVEQTFTFCSFSQEQYVILENILKSKSLYVTGEPAQEQTEKLKKFSVKF